VAEKDRPVETPNNKAECGKTATEWLDDIKRIGGKLATSSVKQNDMESFGRGLHLGVDGTG